MDVFGVVVQVTQSSHTEIGKIQDLLISDSASLFFISKEQTHPSSSLNKVVCSYVMEEAPLCDTAVQL